MKKLKKWVKELEIKTKNPNNPATTLSGGNQQRIVLAKWLACNLDVLILNGPTVGVDIGSKHDIHMVLQRLANQGLGVIIILMIFRKLYRTVPEFLLSRMERSIRI